MHIGIIMDGNGRWARQRAAARSAGHRAGADVVDQIVQRARRRGVAMLTLYAFSSANWQRPRAEVHALLRLLRRYLTSQTARCLEQSVRVNVIGRRDRLPAALLGAITGSERATARCRAMTLRLAIDYSAQHALLAAAARLGPAADRARFERCLAQAEYSVWPAPPVDLLIRTGGELRLSDFLLWECAYAELYFTDCLWPDFDARGLDRALSEFAHRERRFGRLAPVSEARRA